jgi:hypothetical protein
MVERRKQREADAKQSSLKPSRSATPLDEKFNFDDLMRDKLSHMPGHSAAEVDTGWCEMREHLSIVTAFYS